MNIGNNLRKYIDDRNVMNKLFRGEVLDPNNLGPTELNQLKNDLESDLSPENLCCDGELRGRALQAKAKFLNGVKADLEALGVTVNS